MCGASRNNLARGLHNYIMLIELLFEKGYSNIITDKGNTLCFDSLSGRYFKSDIDKIKRAVNNLNRELTYDMYVSLNDFYDELDLDHTKIGDELGWNLDDGLIDVYFGSQR